MELTATYAPEDNKLRLYSSERLETELYQCVRGKGFIYAPKQELFVAPMWTPERADFLIELCGFIGDEETTLEERAAQRAERFEGYQANRAKDAENALNEHDSLKSESGTIAASNNWRSIRKAEKKAQKIENAEKRAIDMWETSEYWEYRASGVLAHAAGRNNTRTLLNRIKKLTASKRKQEKYIKEYQFIIDSWSKKEVTQERAVSIINYLDRSINISRDLEDGNCTPIEAMSRSIARNEHKIDYSSRWASHYENRLNYEKAILDSSGYVEPEKPKRPTQPKLLNYKQLEGFEMKPRGYCDGNLKHWPQVEMTKAEYKAIYQDWKNTRPVEGHRVRTAIMYDTQCTKTGFSRKLLDVVIFLTDSKEHAKPEVAA